MSQSTAPFRLPTRVPCPFCELSAGHRETRHMTKDLEPESPIGRRIHVVGNAGSGKSTVGARLAEVLDAAFVELDALNWEPGWVAVHDADPQELDRRFRAATRGERWIVAAGILPEPLAAHLLGAP